MTRVMHDSNRSWYIRMMCGPAPISVCWRWCVLIIISEKCYIFMPHHSLYPACKGSGNVRCVFGKSTSLSSLWEYDLRVKYYYTMGHEKVELNDRVEWRAAVRNGEWLDWQRVAIAYLFDPYYRLAEVCNLRPVGEIRSPEVLPFCQFWPTIVGLSHLPYSVIIGSSQSQADKEKRHEQLNTHITKISTLTWRLNTFDFW